MEVRRIFVYVWIIVMILSATGCASHSVSVPEKENNDSPAQSSDFMPGGLLSSDFVLKDFKPSMELGNTESFEGVFFYPVTGMGEKSVVPENERQGMLGDTQPKEERNIQANGQRDMQTKEQKNTQADGQGDNQVNASSFHGRTICIDPGHCVTPLMGKGYAGPVSPLSDEVKPLYTSGTHGKNLTEEQLNLMVGIKLRDRLELLGASVLMTREVSEITISGVERCEIANKGGADVNIHIHADGVDDPSPHGVCVLVPTGNLLGTPSIVDESVRLGKLMVNCVADSTGAKNRGIMPRADMTGFNFSEIPTVLIEMGFMTNPEEDALLESDDYQNKIVDGMIQSLMLWYGLE